MAMQFWGTEVKPGQAVSCDVSEGCIVHISQASLGNTKKGSENIVVSVKVDDKKMVIGTLSAEKHPQIMHDLIFEKQFELSHSSKTASVFLCGYKTVMPILCECDSTEDEDEEEETNKNPAGNIISGKAEGKAPLKVNKMDRHGDDSDKDESDDSPDNLSSSSDDMMSENDSSDEEDDSSDQMDEDADEEDDDTPMKTETGKKRVTETVLKTPASDKKTKIATPSGQKTGDKKGAHVATPHPAKQTSKTPTNSKTKEKSPKSVGGSHAGKSCTKTFGDAAPQSHRKAKHNTAK